MDHSQAARAVRLARCTLAAVLLLAACKGAGRPVQEGSRSLTASDAWTANRGIALTDDNSVALLAKHRLTSHAQVRLAIFRYIEAWYNPHRRHSATA